MAPNGQCIPEDTSLAVENVLKEDDVLSSVWVVESDFEPTGKGAEDGVFGDTRDVPCSDEGRVSRDAEARIMDTYRSCPGRASGYRSSSLETL